MADYPPDDDHPGTVTGWLARLKGGDPAAAGPLWRAYYARLVALARKGLRPLPNATADEEDVALSAFDRFCRGVGDGRFPALDDRHDLWKILFDITTKKAIGQRKYDTRQKRGGGRVVPASQAGGGAADVAAGVAGREPTPAFAAEVADECRLPAVGEAAVSDWQHLSFPEQVDRDEGVFTN
mgnify:CR=1 FL=1